MKNKRKWIIIGAILLVLGIIGNLMGDKKEKKEATKAAQESQAPISVEDAQKLQASTSQEVPQQKAQTRAERIDLAGKAAFGASYMGCEPVYEDQKAVFTPSGDLDTEKTPIRLINIKTAFNPGLSLKMEIKAVSLGATKFIEAIKDEDFQTIMVLAPATFEDKYGKKTQEYAVKMELKKEEIQKIDFSNFKWQNLPEIASSYWLHPAVQAELQKK